MKHLRWACCSAAAALLLLLAPPGGAAPAVIAPQQAELITHARPGEVAPPAADDPRWAAAPLAQAAAPGVLWARLRFDARAEAVAPGGPGAATGPAAPATVWALYLPYFYGGGSVWLNGQPVAALPENDDQLRVRLERPLLLALPAGALQPEGNVLLLRIAAGHGMDEAILPPLAIGPQAQLLARHDRRSFFVRTLPLLTLASASIVGLLMLLIWWRRRAELLYGLFGAAALLWALRTATFVVEVLPAPWWDAWRLLYLASTGGFVIALALFTLTLARRASPGWTRGLAGYGLAGVLLYAAGAHAAVERWWVLGLAAIGLGTAVVAVTAALRRRRLATLTVVVALIITALAGLHDVLVADNAALLQQWLPAWAHQRYFLLHHAANLLLVLMGLGLVLRFVRTLDQVEAANRTLEARVREREREIAANYDRIAALQTEQAATDERQRIMRDLHDGLGSQLFISLSRAERGALDAPAMADTLRGAIGQMRVAIEALAADDQDFRTAFGNFRFRWDTRLREAGLQPQWQVALPDAVLAIAPHDALQILHIAQESLTNVVKHARARTVTVQLVQDGPVLQLDITDDGVGLPAPEPAGAGAPGRSAGSGGRGRANMRARAARLKATLEIMPGQGASPGTQIRLRVPLDTAIAPGMTATAAA